MTQDFKKFFSDIYVLLVTFEILSFYPKTDSPYWLHKNVQWITDKFFR